MRWGDRHQEAAVHNNLADLLLRAGDDTAAISHFKQAVVLFAGIGEPDGPHQSRDLEAGRVVGVRRQSAGSGAGWATRSTTPARDSTRTSRRRRLITLATFCIIM